MKAVRISQLPSDFVLDNHVLRVPRYVIKKQGELLDRMIIVGGWNKGFWCKKKIEDSQIYPIFFKNFDEIKNWKIELDASDLLKIKLKGGDTMRKAKKANSKSKKQKRDKTGKFC